MQREGLFFGPTRLSKLDERGQERVKKCRFAISAESALRNLSFGARINDVRDIGIHFRPPEKSLQSISSHVPVPNSPIPEGNSRCEVSIWRPAHP